MGCCGQREKGFTVAEEQKWDYITLSDFHSRSCLAPFSYAWLWVLVIISISVYAADAFTAVNLLAFNKWSSQVQPKVSFDIAKWIFAVCIIISYVFLIYRWIRAIRVIRSGSVAECYLEPLAAIIQSMRITKGGQGWKKFLVFAELTRSKKGVDYIALFVYFQFKSALLIIVAQGPRMAINALTLWAVMQAQLIPGGDHAANDRSAFLQFFVNVETMAKDGNRQETIIYFTMLFSLFIWVIAALSLIASGIFYVFFLWHYIPSSDGRLSKYCRRKIDTRLERIVGKTIKKALEKQNQKRRKEEEEAIKKGEVDGAAHRVPTLPKFGGKDDDTSSVYSMTRSDTMTTNTTLPPYSTNDPARSNTMTSTRTLAMKPSLPSLDERPMPSRSNTGASAYSNMSYGSNAPLMSQGAGMGQSSPAPPLPVFDRNADYFNAPPGGRPMPQGMSASPYAPMNQGRASPRPGPRNVLSPVNTNYPNGRMSPSPQLISPLPNDTRGLPPAQGNYPPPRRVGPSPLAERMGPAYEMSPVDMTPIDNGPQSFYPSSDVSNDYRPPQMPGMLRSGSPAQAPSMNNGFTSPPPSRSGTAPPGNGRAGIPATLQSAIQRREASQPLPTRGMTAPLPQQRSATAPLQQPGWGPGGPRSQTADPYNQGYDGGYGNGQARGGENGW
ncbi:hypothetical protein K504DRAFT_368713 [Pleomassaria siparia CBS 279.74]|uniref:Pheromone-regulated membrane protein n=1 Tax=Pleomassaria siparia CBS 279.74 TaxID=1314801 RepID=A0A6G1KMM2_9PLEO|nr:hypothetical protein K504DRAFT_368713 [Pleomassaria siparia CBS 279.74]